MNISLRRWNLKSKNIYNLRDIGGYACNNGVIKYGMLLRSDELVGLSNDDINYLTDEGLTDVIDLRNIRQQERTPNSFLNHKTVILHTSQPKQTILLSENQLPSKCVGEDYIKLVRTLGKYYVEILEIISQSMGMSIIHCSVGKDRTGVIIALLLLSLGVDERDVIADYQVSETFLKPRFDKDLQNHPDIPRYILSSCAENMQMLIDYINEEYGSAFEYLVNHGMTEENYLNINRRLVTAV